MRLIYAYGSGTTTEDRLAVICGVMAGTDEHWLALEDAIAALKQNVPVPYRPNFDFRASDLLEINDGKFDPEIWRMEDRIRLVGQLVALPAKHRVPVAFGWCEIVELEQVSSAESVSAIHLSAYAHAVAACNSYIASTGAKNELALLFLEDTQCVRQTIGHIHESLKSHDFVNSLGGTISKDLPLRRIKDTVNFAAKNRALFLQLADGCASVIRRHWNGTPGNESLLEGLLGGCPMPAELNRTPEATAGSMCLHWQL